MQKEGNNSMIQYSSATRSLKESLINLEKAVKSELTKMRDIDLIHTNPTEYTEVLDSIAALNKRIDELITLIS